MTVHWKYNDELRTVCGLFALREDGELILEWDENPSQVTCKNCLRSLAETRANVATAIARDKIAGMRGEQ